MRKFIKILVVIIFICTGAILFANIKSSNEDINFEKAGVNAIATVTDIHNIENLDVDSEFASVLEVQFYVKDESSKNSKNQKGKFIKTKIPVKSKDLFKFRKGYKEKIVYLKDDPTTATLYDYIN